MKAAGPVFIVCNARSGSTLLRYLLDAHPDIACPAETKLVVAGRALLSLEDDLSGHLDPGNLDPRSPARSASAARRVITGIMSEYLTRRGKSIWCDKSLDTAYFLSDIARIFPDARYVCLHRHAMDVIASAVEACRWGYARYGFHSYIARRSDNFVHALAEYWTDRTRRITSWEESAAQTHSVHYEHLVRDPGGVLVGVLRFLGLRCDEEIVQDMIANAFGTDHDRGSADQKIRYARTIRQRSVERGRSVPAALIESAQRAEMNDLLATLRYPVITDDWNVLSDIGPKADRALLSAADTAAYVSRLVDGVLAPRLAAAAWDGPAAPRAILTATYGDGQRLSWIIDISRGTVERTQGEASPPLSVTLRAEVLADLLVGGLLPGHAVRYRMVRVRGAYEGAEKHLVFGLLGHMFDR
jgi:sulfotransferase family protein